MLSAIILTKIFSFSAERYDPLTSTWTSIAAMSTRRRYVRVATLGKNLSEINAMNACSFTYLHFHNLLSEMKREFLAWYVSGNIYILYLPPFFPPDGSLYAVGGYDSSSHLATVEKYDPQVKFR